VLPVAGLILARSARTLATLVATALLVVLNLWWVVSVLSLTSLETALPQMLLAPIPVWMMTLGHLVAGLILLAAFGVFAPRSGSPADMAHRAARRGDFRAAGEFWLEAGRPRRALASFVQARAWGRAGEVARSQGDFKHAVILLQKEGGDSLATAAQLAARVGDDTQAQQLWVRHGQHLVETKRPELAIESFARAGDGKRAVHAVELALLVGRIGPQQCEVAIRAARDARRPQLAAEAAVAGARFREAGDLYLVADQPLEAARAFEQAGDVMRAADALQRGGKVEDAARVKAQRLLETGKLEPALAELEAAGMTVEAARTLEKLGRYAEAAEHYRAKGMLREAAELARDHDDPEHAAQLFEELGDLGEAGMAWEKAGRLIEAARCLERAGDWLRAEDVLTRSGQVVELAQMLGRVGRVADGFRALYDRGELRAAWDLLSSYGGTFPDLADRLVGLGRWLEGQGDLPGAISAVQRSVGGLEPRRELLPAFASLADLLEKHGDLRAAEAAWQRVAELEYSYADAAQRLQAVAARRAADGHTTAPGAGGQEITASGDPSARYILEQELGRGGMGVVYRARDSRLGRTVAIKILNPRQHTPEAIRRFEREAQAAAALSHPGIVHIYDFDRGFSSFFISMEFVSGPTINQLVREELPFVRHNLTALMRQILEAVSYAHARQIVHRDLKPANMILAERRQVKILDFGIARRLNELDASASGATGTPYYMAPEQILGEDPDARTDIYALGVTFFQMATGHLPFTTGNILRSHLEMAPPDPLALAPELEPAVAHLIVRCLSKERDSRPRDGGMLLASLEATIQGGTT
jgi:tetratricopeptide (TPR) repeat protein